MSDGELRPFLAYLFDQLVDAGVRRAILCIGYRGEQIRDQFGAAYGPLTLVHSSEPTALGTAGALRHALPLAASDPVLCSTEIRSARSTFPTSWLAISVAADRARSFSPMRQMRADMVVFDSGAKGKSWSLRRTLRVRAWETRKHRNPRATRSPLGRNLIVSAAGSTGGCICSDRSSSVQFPAAEASRLSVRCFRHGSDEVSTDTPSGPLLWTSAFLDLISRHNAYSQRCRSRQVPSCDAVSRLKGRCFMNADESRQHMRAHLLASADVKLRWRTTV